MRELTSGHYLQVREPVVEDIRPSSALTRFLLDFRYLAPFRNANGLLDNGVENLGQISHFLAHLCKN